MFFIKISIGVSKNTYESLSRLQKILLSFISSLSSKQRRVNSLIRDKNNRFYIGIFFYDDFVDVLILNGKPWVWMPSFVPEIRTNLSDCSIIALNLYLVNLKGFNYCYDFYFTLTSLCPPRKLCSCVIPKYRSCQVFVVKTYPFYKLFSIAIQSSKPCVLWELKYYSFQILELFIIVASKSRRLWAFVRLKSNFYQPILAFSDYFWNILSIWHFPRRR